MSFISQQKNLLPVIPVVEAAVAVVGDVDGSCGIERCRIESDHEVEEVVEAAVTSRFPWQLRWKRPQWHRLLYHSSTEEGNAAQSDPLLESVATPKERGNSSSSSSSSKYLMGHSSARITPLEYKQNHGNDINNNNSSFILLLNVSIFQSGTKHVNTDANHHHHPIVPADVIMIDIVRQQPVLPDMMVHDDENTTSSTSSSIPYEYVHRQTLYWPDTNRNGNRNDENRTLATTTTLDDGPCSLFLQQNPLLQFFHHIVVHPFLSPQPPTAFQPILHDIESIHPSSASTTTTTTRQIAHPHHQTVSNDKDTTATGLIAVTLLRVPRTSRGRTSHDDDDENDGTTHPHQNKNVGIPDHNTMSIISTADAYDVLNLLSLQGSAFGTTTLDPSPTETSTTTTYETNTSTTTNYVESKNDSVEHPQGDIENDDDDDEASDLVLACLTSDGKVHLYSPWKLLLLGSNKNHNSHSKNSSNMLSSFWFGSGGTNLLQDNNVLPLRESIASIELSLPYLRKRQQHRHPSTSLANHPKKQHPPPSLISMFDTSMWDATLDPTTLHHQTIHNIPTHCIAAHDEYICIVGRGQKRWHYNHQTTTNNKNMNMNDDDMNAVPHNNGENCGGFITFITTQTMSEKRTMFLPFVPEHISPFYWGAMKLLLVTGQGHAIAIRLDGGRAVVPTIPLSLLPCMGDKTMLEPLKKQATVTIHRFQILPIELSNVENNLHYPTIVGGEILTSPPAIVLLYDNDSNLSNEGLYVVRQTLVAFETKNVSTEYQHRPDNATTIVITTSQHDTTTAWIPLVRAAHQKIWCQLGQGCCIVGAGRRSFFICYDGSSKDMGPVIKELSPLDVDDGDDVIQSSVLPPASFINRQRNGLKQYDTGRDVFIPNRTMASNIPDTRHDTRPESFKNSEYIDDIIVEAMESISTLAHRENFGSNSPTSVTRRNRQLSLTTQEKSERLLRHCSSWTKLDQSLQSLSMFQSQTPSMTLRTQRNSLSTLTLRSIVIEHGPAASFQQVLAWLSMHNDFFTAASIALKLLQDAESLRHLWLTFNKLENDEKSSYLDGLLDGILPLGTYGHDATITRLADMAVACLVKGGYEMSSTLEQFLSRNMKYDPSRASLMLVASAIGALSDDEAHVASVMGKGYSHGPNHVACALWPVRCLLEIGVARNRLGSVLLLVNTTIPDELRRRTRFGSRAVTPSSLELCKSIVTLIVETSPDSTEILLDLVDERSRLRFWESLDHEMRLELSVIAMSGSYPLLQDQEIRSWIIAELQKCIESEDLASAANVYDKTPTAWLRAITSGCLQNAGCDMELILHPKLDESKDDIIDSCDFYRFKNAIQIARIAVTPVIHSGGLDFDILIPALLVLDHRNEIWHNEAGSCTRTVLNAVCYQAGRGELDEPLFVMNSAALMRQCFRLGDVEAAAMLIGGKNGFVLQICNVLNEELGLSMDDAERYALGESLTVRGEHSTTLVETFSIKDSHRRLLLLLDEHVLKIRTYGNFTESRGKVDPVFAATLFFRTWWAITKPMLTEATLWLTDWLRRQLRISVLEKTEISPYRLTCAALTQALIWPQGNDKDILDNVIDTTPLANKLEMDGIFLLQMTRSCCGMVEALPPNVLEASESNVTNVVVMAKASLTPISKGIVVGNDTSMYNRSEFGNDDSFISAVGTYRDMDISHTTWNT